MPQQELAGADDLGHARLVIRSQKGTAIGDDELLAHVVGKLREVLQKERLAVPQPDIPALIAETPGLHILPADAGSRVHVGKEAQPRQRLAAGAGRQHPVDIAILILLHMAEAQFCQLLRQSLAQNQLPRRGGHGPGLLV